MGHGHGHRHEHGHRDKDMAMDMDIINYAEMPEETFLCHVAAREPVNLKAHCKTFADDG
jgi:hypothetical protein